MLLIFVQIEAFYSGEIAIHFSLTQFSAIEYSLISSGYLIRPLHLLTSAQLGAG